MGAVKVLPLPRSRSPIPLKKTFAELSLEAQHFLTAFVRALARATANENYDIAMQRSAVGKAKSRLRSNQDISTGGRLSLEPRSTFESVAPKNGGRADEQSVGIVSYPSTVLSVLASKLYLSACYVWKLV